MAGILNKVKNAVMGENNDHHDTINPTAPHGGSRTTDTDGPHNSNVANKLDPRVDSDRDGRADGFGHSSGGAGYGSQHQPGATSGYGNTSTNAGPHSSSMANKLDPRIDSDKDGRSGVEFSNNNTRGSTGGGLLSSSTHQHSSTNAGPHNSNVANKLDPRVDSDRDGRATHGNTHGSTSFGGLGSSATHSSTTGGTLSSTRGTSAYDSGANNGPHDSRVANKLDSRVDSSRDGVPSDGIYNPHGTTAGAALGLGHHNVNNHNTSTNAGPHNSDTANKLDPRVDSDRDGRNTLGGNTVGGFGGQGTHNPTNTHGNTVGGFGTHTSSNAGPHESNIANKLDPRVDSDRDGRGAHGTSGVVGVGGFGGTHGAHQAMPGTYSDNNNLPALNAGTHGSGTHNTTAGGLGSTTSNAGPHSSNVANKLDPTVDSDLDGRGTHGSHNTHNTSATALGAGVGGLGTHGTHSHHSNLSKTLDPRVDSDRDGHRGTHGTEYPQKYDPLVTSIPGTHDKPPGAPMTAPPHTVGTSRIGDHNNTHSGLGDHHNTHGTHGTTSGLNTHSGLGDHHDTHGTHGTTSGLNTHNKTTTSGIHDNHGANTIGGTHSGPGAHGSNLPGPAPNTAGPHKSDLLNKLDPKVDSDMDGKAGFMS